MSNFNKPRRKNVERGGDGNRDGRGGLNRQSDLSDQDEPRDEPQDKLSKAFRELLGREPDDGDRQQLFRIMQVMGVQDNDAIYSIALLLYSYEEKIGRIPDQIKKAALEQQVALKAGADLGAIQAQEQINDSVLALLPNIRADIKSVVGRSASTAIRRIELGRGMLSLGAGAAIASGLIVIGILLESGLLHDLVVHPKDFDYCKVFGLTIGIAIATPITFGLGIYAIEADYNSQLKFAGWLGIIFSTGAFLAVVLKIVGIIK